ncbi:hypothetical protein ACJMK2_033252 [Sinanodonta woodiana]|uniref:NF-X1-type zinc finger protein NFXL1 n=1 Tax=Sinanodonta woodiana TaxID=1069815 RepID=A0ABD3X5R7_SINWO
MSEIPVYLRGRGRGRGREESQLHAHVGADEIKTAQQRFDEISSKHKESIQRFLDNDDTGADSSEDEDDIGDNILQTVFKGYSNDLGVGDANKAQEILLHSFRSSTSACLVCIESIKKNDPIWSCKGCCGMFHIQCIQKWVKEGVYQIMYKTGEENNKQDIPWYCPKCRLEYHQRECPTRYFCFCGKEEDPKFDPWLVPHSCGQTCGRPLKPDCGHKCLLLCHPGACPPCPVTVKWTCHCGKQPLVVRRCSARPWACTLQCGRKLTCGHHTCQKTCHDGECPPCPKTSTQSCLCGKQKAVRPCASPEWQCGQPCGQVLSCRNHICEEMCHKGVCGSCPRGGIRHCPCGKTEYDRPCTEDIPTCGDTCGKLLDCGLHTCAQRCHTGLCGTCRQMAVKICRCGQKEKEVPCCKEYLCETKCNKQRDCGKHQCKRKCCDGNCPSCEQTCGKPLSCTKHKCASRCHRGPCYPCAETIEITCFCKATKITVPCGREKVTRPPRCNQTCRQPPDCHHSERTPHRCHFGNCPPCKQICQKSLPNCQHSCSFICHSAVRVKMKDRTPRAGPWESRQAEWVEVVNKLCPPCPQPIKVECRGKHEITTVPCAEVQPYSCGRKCGRKLPCGNHSCSLNCHTVERATADNVAGTNCEKCELPCQRPRPEGCTHECLLHCHPDACPECSQMFRMRCHCLVTMQHVPCSEWTQGTSEKKDQLKSCGGQCPKLLSCGHPCGLTCHPGSCLSDKQCEKKVNVRCSCRRRKREFQCRDVQTGKAKLECDDICIKENEKKKQKEEEMERHKKEEELKKQQAELEEFERKMKGKRRKQRKHHEVVEKESCLQKFRGYIIVCAGVVVLAVFAGYLLSTKIEAVEEFV